MRKEKIMKKIMLLSLLTAVLFVMCPLSAEAKERNNKLNVNQTYTQYDITGDRKADTLLIAGNWNSKYEIYEDYSVYVNGQKVLAKRSEKGPLYALEVRRLELKNGKVFLAIVTLTDNGDVPDSAVYQYKAGKLNKVIDLDSMSRIGYHNSVESIKVAGNKITVKYGVMSYSLSGISFCLDYQYKNGKMVQKTTKAKLTSTILKYQKKTYWTANRSMKVLKSPGGKKVTTLAKGKKVKIDKIYINSKHNKIYLHVKIKGGKSGWVKGLTKYPKSAPMFKEVMYAG